MRSFVPIAAGYALALPVQVARPRVGDWEADQPVAVALSYTAAVSESTSPRVLESAGRFSLSSVMAAPELRQADPTTRVRETRLVSPLSGLRAYQTRVQVSSPVLAWSPMASDWVTMPYVSS